MSDSTVAFRALQLANQQRTAYGLRYHDFERYRKHCANRTHRLRSSLKMTHGKGREFKKLPPIKPDTATDGHLQLLLFEAERAWAYAQELIASALLPANEDRASSLRHTATGRFRRAVHWSTELLSLCQTLYSSSRLSPESLIEATVYTLTLNGRFLRYRDDFEDALIQLSVARSLLTELEGAASTSRDQALAVLFSDEISPEIRYCAHELGHPEAYNIPAVVSQVAPKHKNGIVENYDALVKKLHEEGSSVIQSKARLTDRFWDGEKVPVRFPELVDALLKVEAAESSLGQGQKDGKGKKSKLGVTAYDAVLLALSEAEDVARKLEEAQQSSGSSSTSGPNQGRDIYFVHAYIVYQLLSRRIERDLLLMSTLLSSESSDKSEKGVAGKAKTSSVDARLYPALVKLLDAVLQSLAQMRNLSLVEDNPDLVSAVEARVAFTTARRCIYLAQCYAQTKRYAEALALSQHATLRLRESSSSLSLLDEDPIATSTPYFFPLKAEDIKDLENTLAQDSLKYKRDWFAYNGGSIDVDPSSYEKPLFFNIALNYVELDMDRLRERAGKRPTAATQKPTKKDEAAEKKPVQRTKAEEMRAPTPEPDRAAAAKGGLSSLLGGWWSRS